MRFTFNLWAALLNHFECLHAISAFRKWSLANVDPTQIDVFFKCG